MILTQIINTTYTPHPEGIYAAVCVDVIDLGMETSTYEGVTKTQPKLRLVFETHEGEPRHIGKKFTASMHQKAKLTEFLGKWRGRPVIPGEQVDLSRLMGANCTLVIGQSQSQDGTRTYSNIDAISKPTKKLVPSGKYDPVAVRAKIDEWAAKDGKAPLPVAQTYVAPAPAPAPVAPVKSVAAPKAAPVDDVDPEVGF